MYTIFFAVRGFKYHFKNLFAYLYYNFSIEVHVDLLLMHIK